MHSSVSFDGCLAHLCILIWNPNETHSPHLTILPKSSFTCVFLDLEVREECAVDEWKLDLWGTVKVHQNCQFAWTVPSLSGFPSFFDWDDGHSLSHGVSCSDEWSSYYACPYILSMNEFKCMISVAYILSLTLLSILSLSHSMAQHTLKQTIQRHYHSINALAFSPDRLLFASTGNDGLVIIF